MHKTHLRQPIAGDLISHTVIWRIDGRRQLRHFDNLPEAQAHAQAQQGIVIDIRTTMPTTTPGLTTRDADVDPDPDGTRLMVVTTADGQTRVGELEISPNGSVEVYRLNSYGYRFGLGGYLGTTSTTEEAMTLLARDFHIDYQNEICAQGLHQFHIDLELGHYPC